MPLRVEPERTERGHFLNGWIGEQLAKLWLQHRGFAVKQGVAQRRGNEKAVSTGDIDLVARKGSRTLYAEVKFWGAGGKKTRLTPSWLVQFMLDKEKLKTLFENHDDATGYMLFYRYAGVGQFRYRGGTGYVQRLESSNYGVPADILRRLDGCTPQQFAETVLKFLVCSRVGRSVEFNIVYFEQVLAELKPAVLEEFRGQLGRELGELFEAAYSDVVAG